MKRVNQEREAKSDQFAMPSLVMAAHELKSPLALLRQLSLAIESGAYAGRDIEQLARRMELTSERALRLVEDVTRSARLDDALFSLEPVNPLALSEAVVREISPLYAAHDCTIELPQRRQPPLVVANRSLLRSILLQFADNALHYADSSRPVRLESHARGGVVRISVRDYGPGLTTAVWSSLKRRPTNSEPHSIGRRPQSSGLGLAISRQFASAMNGRVGAIRHRDGTSFYVELAGSTQTSWL